MENTVNTILYSVLAAAVIASTVSGASAQSGRDRRAIEFDAYGQSGWDWRAIQHNAYGQVDSNGALQTGPWSEPRRAIERPLRRMPPFTWEEKRHFDYQNQTTDN
jgi:hypothetical protein